MAGKSLTYTSSRSVFARARDHEFAGDFVMATVDHSITPNNSQAFNTHDAAMLAKFRHAACDAVIGLIEEARSQFAKWEPAG